MNVQELKKLQIKLNDIVSSLIIEGDEKEINNLQKEALEIINNRNFKVHINDYITKGRTILDAVNLCSTGVGQEYTKRKGLEEIKEAIENAGGKTSQELGRKSNLRRDEHNSIILPSALIAAGFLSLVGSEIAMLLTFRAGTITTDLGEVLIMLACATTVVAGALVIGLGISMIANSEDRQPLSTNLQDTATAQPNMQEGKYV